jgi:hypothetical protein
MQPWFYFSYMEAKNLSKEEQTLAVASERYTEQIFADILIQGQGSGSFLLRDPQLTASVIKAMVQDWYLKRSKYARRKISVDQYARFILQFVESFISGAEENIQYPGQTREDTDGRYPSSGARSGFWAVRK